MAKALPDRDTPPMASRHRHRHRKRNKTPRPVGGVTRREFVATLGTFTGAIAVGVPVLPRHQAVAVAAADQQPAAAKNLVSVYLIVNGEKRAVTLDPRVTLLDLLREEFSLTGTKKGCDHGQCGACTVLVNGVRINSCLALAVTLDGDEVTTIEGLSRGDDLHPMQAAFLEHDGLQCGYCTPGQICSAVALLKEARDGDASAVTTDLRATGPVNLTPDEIRERMSGNICRCGAYTGIVAAVQSVSSAAGTAATAAGAPTSLSAASKPS